MINIFSKEGEESLKKLSKENTIYCFDFDGTLSPLVDTPSQAFLPDSTKKNLIKIRRFAPVAIISGRSTSNLKELFGFECDYLIGNHGLEEEGIQKSNLDEYKRNTQEWFNFLNNYIYNHYKTSDIFIENKEFSLSVHYKRAEDLNLLNSLLLELAPRPLIIQGKSVINLIPDFQKNKGTAILNLMKRHDFKSALFAGDDVTDEDVFKLNNSNILTICVGNNNKTQAKFYLEDQNRMDILLEKIYIFLK